MSDTISKKAAYEVLTEYYHHKTELQHKALREALDRVPGKEIIHCKDCKYFGNIGDDFMCRKPDAWVVPTTSDFGCVLAERKGKQDALN